MTTITEASRELGVSTRMLRYYEQQGLIVSCRREGYAYRLYDGENINRLRIILVLRRLRVPLKDIGRILMDCDADQAIAILQERVQELDGEVRSLTAVRDVLTMFIGRIAGTEDVAQRVALMGDEGLLRAIRTLGLSNPTLKERTIMNEINHAEQEQWRKMNVRLMHLPPMTVAAFHYIGPECEEHAQALVTDFIRSTGLYERKPDARMFGFNHPSPTKEQPIYGYEYWVSIPEDMEVPAPGVRKRFAGGLFAVHCMAFPNFHEWQWLVDWVNNHEELRMDLTAGDDENMEGCLEEHLNWVYAIHSDTMQGELTRKLDLMLPVAKKQ